MSGVGAWLDRLASQAADRLLTWTAGHTGPAGQEWLQAIRGELASLDTGPARLAWALGGLRLAWTFNWRWQMLRGLRRMNIRHWRGAQPRATRWHPALLAPVVALVAVVSVGVFAASSATAQVDSQCTTAHTPESSPPATLVSAQDYLALGDYDYERGDCVQAILDYGRAIDLDPSFAAAHNNRAYTAMRRQDYAAALPDLDRAIALRPDYVAALMNRGDVHNYYFAVDRQLALADYDRVIALGGGRATSVCGHRLLAAHNGWSPGVLIDLLTQGVDAGCS